MHTPDIIYNTRMYVHQCHSFCRSDNIIYYTIQVYIPTIYHTGHCWYNRPRALGSLNSVVVSSNSASNLYILYCYTQILFIVGIICIIGAERTYRFFFQSHKLKGTAFFSGGIFIVIVGFPIIGILVEFYGAFLLFG